MNKLVAIGNALIFSVTIAHAETRCVAYKVYSTAIRIHCGDSTTTFYSDPNKIQGYTRQGKIIKIYKEQAFTVPYTYFNFETIGDSSE